MFHRTRGRDLGHAIIVIVRDKWCQRATYFFIGGIAMALVAAFAGLLGLDPSPGWGAGRIALLVAGVLIAGLVALSWSQASKRDGPSPVIHAILDKLPGIRTIGEQAWYVRFWDAGRKYRPAIMAAASVIIVYVWLVSSGTWTRWNSPTRYYADLARGFQRGHLYLAVKVSPELLKSPDPYEPFPSGATQGPLDYSYYNGRYYLPWGPVPALIVLAFHRLFHIWLGDLQLTFGFACGLLLVLCVLLTWFWGSYSSALPQRLLWMSLLFVGLAGPIPFMLNSYLAASIYEAAITGGQLFLMSGFLVAIIALKHLKQQWILAIAATLWSLAMGTRLDLALPVGVMVLAVTLRILKVDDKPASSFGNLAALYSPLALGCALIGGYNLARFGNIFETGYRFILAGVNIHEHWNEIFSVAYVLPNMYAYLLHRPQFTSTFPFVEPGPAQTSLVFHFSQRITGLAWQAPFLLFALIPAAQIVLMVSRRQARGLIRIQEDANVPAWVSLTLLGSSLIAFCFLLLYFWSAMRFFVDFLPGLMLVSIIGFWQGYRALQGRANWQRIYETVGLALAGASVAVSLLAAISTNDARFGIIRALFTVGR